MTSSPLGETAAERMLSDQAMRLFGLVPAAGLVEERPFGHPTGVLSEPKTDSAKRSIPLPPSLGKMLAAHRLASAFSSETDFVFCSAAGTPLQVREAMEAAFGDVLGGFSRT